MAVGVAGVLASCWGTQVRGEVQHFRGWPWGSPGHRWSQGRTMGAQKAPPVGPLPRGPSISAISSTVLSPRSGGPALTSCPSQELQWLDVLIMPIFQMKN